MTDKEYKRSRFAGMPGSVAAIRVDYSRRLTAFDPPAPDSQLAQTKREVRHWKNGHRLGDKVDWDASAPGEKDRLFPRRQLMHQLSEFQAVKIEYNYRAATLPSINHDQLYVAKPSKLEVDRRIFLSPKEKARLVDKCPATVTKLSLFEMRNDPAQLPTAKLEAGWNASSELPRERASVFAVGARTGGSATSTTEGSFVAINKTKGILNHESYISPRQRVEQQIAQVRETKLATRSTTAGGNSTSSSSGGGPLMPLSAGGGSHSAPLKGRSGNGPSDGAAGHPAVFKMSNIDQWMGVPQEVAHLRTMLGNSQQAVMAAQAASSAAAAKAEQQGGGGSGQDPVSPKNER